MGAEHAIVSLAILAVILYIAFTAGSRVSNSVTESTNASTDKLQNSIQNLNPSRNLGNLFSL
jgi:hypothetical protein